MKNMTLLSDLKVANAQRRMGITPKRITMINLGFPSEGVSGEISPTANNPAATTSAVIERNEDMIYRLLDQGL